MDFLSNLADSTPIVGTFKGIYHYACNDQEKGDKAMYQSTRTTAVIAGGLCAGPAGAIAAGLATDTVASTLTNEEKGHIKSLRNISADIEANRNPMGSIASASFQLGLDGISGYGGSSGGVSNSYRSALGKSMQKGGEQVIQKSVRISSEEAAKMLGRRAAERATWTVAENVAERAFLASAHVGFTAAQRTHDEEYERREMKWEEKEREKRRKLRKREKEQREWRDKEQIEREWEELEWRERLKQEQKEKELRDWVKQERREQEWREWRDGDLIEREWEELDWRERLKQEQKEKELREWVKQERRDREWRKWNEREQREREWRAQEQREKEQQGKCKQQKNKQQKECKKSEQRNNKEKPKRDSFGSNSGSSQSPQGNKNNNNKDNKKNEASFFETFMNILRRILKIVYGNDSEPFSNIFETLPKDQRKYLAKVLKPLMGSDTFEVVIEMVIRLFKKHYHQDISFLNFLSLLEIVQTYICDELLERTRIASGTETAETKMKPEQRREQIISEIAGEKESLVDDIKELFEQLKTEILSESALNKSALPDFRDNYAAVYHYYKHRKCPHDGRILTVKEYYDWVTMFLEELKHTNKLTELKESKSQNYIHEIFVPVFRRRFRLVMKFQDDKVVLNSAFVVKAMHLEDIEKHGILIAADIFSLIFAIISIIFIFKNILLYGPLIMFNTTLIVLNSLAFIVNLIFSTLLFIFSCVIFLLKVLFSILFLAILVWYLFFYLPDQR